MLTLYCFLNHIILIKYINEMNTMNFIAIVIVLAFATGFLVAALIWGISWLISPKEAKETINKN